MSDNGSPDWGAVEAARNQDNRTIAELASDIKRTIRKTPKTREDLTEIVRTSPERVQMALDELRKAGCLLHTNVDGTLALLTPSGLETNPPSTHIFTDRGDGWQVFGFTSDNHLCNRHARLDVLREAYKTFAAEGITTVFNGGNWIDGECRFNKCELVTAPGLDHQLDYFIQEWPAHPGITTKYIAGDDHEGWYAQRENIEVGRYLEMRAKDQGRNDLSYLGYGEADIQLQGAGGSAVMRVVHPGGGSAYALSYAPQKIVEMYQGGEKPSILMVGHYHKFDWCPPREVQVVQMGCTCDQTMFLRKKKIQVFVGFGIIKMKQDPWDGHITRFAVEWFPFFDRGYYERRFSGR